MHRSDIKASHKSQWKQGVHCFLLAFIREFSMIKKMVKEVEKRSVINVLSTQEKIV